jgi:PAS domain S-box-containing protein
VGISGIHPGEWRPPLPAVIAAAAALGTGVACLLGYALEVPLLARGWPGYPVLAPGAAVALILAAAGLVLVTPPEPAPARHRPGRLVGAAVAVFGLVSIVENLTGRSTVLDRLFFAGTAARWDPGAAGRCAPLTALALTLLGLGILLLDADAGHGFRPARVLAPATALPAVVALLGYAYGLSYVDSSAHRAAGMPVPAAVAVLGLAAGLVFSRPRRPPAVLLTGSGLAGRTVRRLAPLGAGVVVLTGLMLAVTDRARGGYGGTGVAVAVTALLVALSVGFCRTAAALDAAEAQQRDLIDALRAQRDFSDTVLHSLHDGLMVADATGSVTHVNSRWCEILGYPVDRVIGCRPPYPWWPPELLAQRSAELSTALTSDHPSELDSVSCRFDGTRVILRTTVSRVLAADGRPRMSISTIRDLTELNRAEADRARATRQLDHFFTLSGDLLCILGSDGHLTRLNLAWERLLDYPAAELCGRSFLEMVHPDDIDRTVAELAATSHAVPGSILFENRLRCRDGGYRWLSWQTTQAPDEEVIYAVGRDVTEQREANEARARLAAIVDSTTDAVISQNLDGTITTWNSGAERIYGYSADEIIGRPVTTLATPDHAGEIDKIEAAIARGESIREYDTVRVRRDGTLVPTALSMAPIRTPDGTIVGAASIARDVTEQKRAEERFRRLVISAPDAMLIVDGAGTITLINEQTERLFGYPNADLIGAPVELLLPPELRDRHARHRESFTAAPAVRPMGAGLELLGRRRDGSTVPIEVNLAPLETEAGMLVAAAIRDVTGRRQVEQALAAARDEALATAQAKAQFVAMVSHEVRTPMNGVLGLTKLLLDTPLQPQQRRYTEAAYASARALLTVVNDVLDFTKVDAGKIDIVVSDFDLGLLVDEVIHVAAEAARDKEIEILGHCPPQRGAVRGDGGRVRQVLLNLVGNAVKFTSRGEIVLRIDPPAAAETRYTFSVRDTGIGISEEDLPRLFEPFIQANPGNTRVAGTGLGLTISRRLVELMGGELRAESQPGHGSHFSFSIPLAPQPDSTGGRDRLRDGLADRRVLIVDDNPTSRALLAEQARCWRIAADTAPDGDTAILRLRQATARRQPYEVALLDQRMPDLDGYRLARHIAADPAIAATRLVLLTSGPHGGGPAPDGVELLAKPVGPSALYNCLLGLLLPDRAEPGPAEPPRPRPAAHAGLVLLAEDNDINQLVAVDTLAVLGYQADVAHNGLEAIQLAAAKPYQAILMDCQMPTMDGFEATRELRRRETPEQHTPIIAMTAGALTEDRQRCLDAGMDDYLAKPIDTDALRAALERWTAAGPVRAGAPAPRAP